jgi:hypothetical protein
LRCRDSPCSRQRPASAQRPPSPQRPHLCSPPPPPHRRRQRRLGRPSPRPTRLRSAIPRLQWRLYPVFHNVERGNPNPIGARRATIGVSGRAFTLFRLAQRRRR